MNLPNQSYSGEKLFKGFGGCESLTYLTIWSRPGLPYVAMLTEVPENTGTSITNAAETVWDHVLKFSPYDLGPDTICIEHYPPDDWEKNDRYSTITFDAAGRPKWISIDEVALRELIQGESHDA